MQRSHFIVITDDHARAITRLTNWEYDEQLRRVDIYF